jgi:putative Mg2+ transporter-C (MgtC) family protein
LDLDLVDALARVGLAGILGAAVGFERDLNGHLAGMRTHALVASGAALFTLAGAYGFSDFEKSANVDPMRVAAQIVSGIGFIGAGVIIRDGGSVRGVTTAAALWASSALGLACGAGEYTAAAAGLAVVLASLVALRAVRDRGLVVLGAERNSLEVTYERGHGTLVPIIDAIERAGATVEGLHVHDDGESRHLRLRVRGGRSDDLRVGLHTLSDRPEIMRLAMAKRRGPKAESSA